MTGSKKIFLVEDDKDDQFFFTHALSEIENAILHGVANNGKEAIEILENSVVLPDIIFSDINMPVMNGIECLAEIIKNPLTRNIPVVILSSSIPLKGVIHTLGARAFIEKPSDCNVLRDKIEKIINSDFIVHNSPTNHNSQSEFSGYYIY